MKNYLLACLLFSFLALPHFSIAQFFIFGNVSQTELATSSFRVSYTTNTAAKTLVRYGLTTAVELGALSNGQTTTAHSIELTGLNAGTVYYVKAGVINGTDTIMSTKTNVFSTVSNSTGTIKVFFNKDIDTYVSTGSYPNLSNSPAAIQAELIKLIDSAQTSIDVCVYNNNTTALVTALKNAHNRGVRVRYIADAGTSNTALSPAPPFPVLSINPIDIMHNKFVIFDVGNVNKSWVWTGSMNWTSNNINTDFNNVILLQDQSLAKAYTLEFEEMWGASGATPNAGNSKSGSQKLDNTPHKFIIGGKPVECYFSPSDGVTSKIEAAILSADNDVQFALFSFTKDELGNALINRHNAGERVAGIIENIGDLGNEFTPLVAAGVNVVQHSPSGDLHHKYAIIDAGSPNSDPMVITGSHNWSQGAESVNDENTLIIHDATIANWYLQEFSKRWCDIAATPGCHYTVPIAVRHLEQNNFDLALFPNPAQNLVQLQLTGSVALEGLRLQVYNQLGQMVAQRNLVDAQSEQSVSIENLPNGSYWIRLENKQGLIATKALQVLR